MPHEFHGKAKRSLGDKLDKLTGHRGEYPPDRAARIAAVPTGKGQGDSAQPTDEQFAGAPARQISNYGKVIK